MPRMRFDVYSLTAQSKKRYEVLYVALVCAMFLAVSWNVLFTCRRMFEHDTIWGYGLMHYFFNSLMQGIFPYWDPYDYAGQPFYYNLGISRIFEIPTMLLIGVNSLIQGSLLTLYHWDFSLKLICAAIGTYLCFRQTTTYIVSSAVVLLAFLFSSFTFSSMVQNGLVTSFAWMPWIMWFFFRLKKSLTLYNTVGFSLFLGLSMTSYQAGYVFTFLQIFILSLLCNHRDWFTGLLRDKKTVSLSIIGLCIVTALSLQLFAVYIEKENSVPVLRQLDSSDGASSYADKIGGSPAYPHDFLGLILPPLAIQGWRGSNLGLHLEKKEEQWLPPMSECPFYIGILPLLLALWGLARSRHAYRFNFFLTLFAIILLSLDLHFKINPWSHFLFPFLLYARNMEMFQPFIIFALMYFVGQGTDILLEWSKRYGA
jgi:hypothetical protein